MLKPLLMAFAAGAFLLVGSALLLTGNGPNALAKSTVGSAHYERLDRIAAVKNAERPSIGEKAQDLDVKDEIGARFRLSNGLGRPVLFGAFCACSTCRETAQRWRDLLAAHPTRFMAAALVAIPRGEALFDFHDSLRLNFPLIPDPDHELSELYPGPGDGSAALGCPRAWVIGKDGRYRYVMPMGAAPTERVMAAIRRALGLPAQESGAARTASAASSPLRMLSGMPMPR